jgi:hypothetical protein
VTENILYNPTFDPSLDADDGSNDSTWGYEDTNIYGPKGWGLGWLNGEPFDGIHDDPPDLVARRPEAKIITEWDGLEPALTPDDSYAWDVFVRNPLYAWLYPAERPDAPEGVYRLMVKVWPKLHMSNGEHPGDPWAAEVGLRLQNSDEIQWRSDLNYAGYNVLAWEFEHPGGPLGFDVVFKGKYPIDNTFFFHWIDLRCTDCDDDSEPPDPPPDEPSVIDRLDVLIEVDLSILNKLVALQHLLERPLVRGEHD